MRAAVLGERLHPLPALQIHMLPFHLPHFATAGSGKETDREERAITGRRRLQSPEEFRHFFRVNSPFAAAGWELPHSGRGIGAGQEVEPNRPIARGPQNLQGPVRLGGGAASGRMPLDDFELLQAVHRPVEPVDQFFVERAAVEIVRGLPHEMELEIGVHEIFHAESVALRRARLPDALHEVAQVRTGLLHVKRQPVRLVIRIVGVILLEPRLTAGPEAGQRQMVKGAG